MNSTPSRVRQARRLAGCVAILLSGGLLQSGAQQTPASAPPNAPASNPSSEPVPTPAPSRDEDGDDMVVLSPFVVEATEDEGYLATSTLAGTRIRSNLRDLGSAISVVTEQFMNDTNSKNVEDMLVYTTNTEIGGVAGNFTGLELRQGGTVDETGSFTRQNTNNRIRGLGGADNTRDYFLTDIPSDSYNVGRWDIQRGPNSILFGQGKSSGVINASPAQATFKTAGKYEIRFDNNGGLRNSVDYNQVLRPQELAVRVSGLLNNTKYRQEPAFEDDTRIYAALRYDPKFLAKNGFRTTFRANYESGEIEGMRPRTLPPIDRMTPWFRTEPFIGDANPIVGVTSTNPNGKPAATYPALNRRLFDNWRATNQATWANTGWNYGTNPRPTANIYDPNSASSMLPSARQWRNPTSTNSASRTYVAGWEVNPGYEPFIAEVFTGGLNGFGMADGSGETFAQYANAGPTLQYGINNGTTRTYNTKFTPVGFVPDGNVGYYRYTQYLAISAPWLMYRDMQVPFGGLYRDPSLTDRGVFDFINQNLDGDLRRHWRNFDAYNLALDQTFLDNRAGVSVVYDKQDYDDGSHSIFNDRTQMVTVDINATLPASGLPNPNAGKAVMMGDGNYGTRITEREEIRATAFAEVQATDFLQESWLTKVLGRHIFTGMFSQNTSGSESRGYRRFMVDPEDVTGINRNVGYSGDATSYRTVMYLTNDSLTDTSKYPTMSSLNLKAPSGWRPPETVRLNYFDSHWVPPTDSTAAGYVDPNAVWLDTWGLNTAAYPAPVSNSVQRNNPANYVGWRNKDVRLLDATDPEDRPRMNTSLSLGRTELESIALVWQGFLFKGDLVPTFGYREDTAKFYSFFHDRAGIPGRSGIYRPVDVDNPATANIDYPANPEGVRTEDGFVIQDSPFIRLPGTPEREQTTHNRSWSLVGHLPEFLRQYLPWGTALSLSYNESSNFDPSGGNRRDMWNKPVEPPGGETKDYGILVSMLENRVNFRVIKFESSIARQSLGFPSQWHQIEGRSWVAAKKMLDAIKAAETYDYQYNDIPGVTRLTSSWDNPNYLYGTINPTDSQRILYASQAEKNALLQRGRDMANMIVNGLPPELAAAWNIDTTSELWRNTTDIGNLPSGVTSIQDRTSEGWEYELTVSPLKNWRITANYSDTTASQDNSFSDIKDYAFERDAYWTGAAGAWYYSNPGRETQAYRDDWSLNVMGAITSRLLADGQVVQEAVQKRFNLVTTYDFSTDRFKGVSIGGGYRWEDAGVLGYKYKYVPLTSGTRTAYYEVPDLEQPIYGEMLNNFDLWVSYNRKLTEKVRWKIQLNVRNVGDSAELVPVGAQPNGDIVQYRIKDGMSWAVTNTFSF
jgi:hypothetical protein